MHASSADAASRSATSRFGRGDPVDVGKATAANAELDADTFKKCEVTGMTKTNRACIHRIGVLFWKGVANRPGRTGDEGPGGSATVLPGPPTALSAGERR